MAGGLVGLLDDLAALAPPLVEVILMLGGACLCYEGAHKVHHRLTHPQPR